MNVALRYAARSDIGLVRANNQDSGYAGPHLLAVCDGMGGHAGGDVASSVAIAELAPLDEDSLGPDEALAELEEALQSAHEDLAARIQDEPDLEGMGTTVTAILRTGNKLAMVHIGDSRAYLLRDGVLIQVTVDHTLVQHWVTIGRITEEEAELHPHRNVVLRVLTGSEMDIVPDYSVREARAGDRWLLCSDGLSGYASLDIMDEILRTTTDVDQCADELVQCALKAGGPDNITVIVADVVDLDSLPDGEAPSTNPQVVGSAAVSRHAPTVASGPASKAAALTSPRSISPVVPEVEEVVSGPRARRGILRTLLTTLIVLAVIAGGLFAAYRWTQSQYYLGISDGYVAVFQGIPQSVGPVDLSHVVHNTGTSTDALPQYIVDRLRTGIMANSQADADRRYTELVADLLPEPTPEPTPEPSLEPTVPQTPDLDSAPDNPGSDPPGAEAGGG